jgi:hypothetical protein
MNPRIETTAVLALAGSTAAVLALLLKPGERRKSAAFLLGWLLPGAGHVLLGRRRKGLFFAAVLVLTWLFGMWLVGFRPVSWDDNPFYYIGQYGSGAAFAVAKALAAEKAFPRPDLPPSWFDPGLLYVCVAGLLNFVVALNVFDLRDAKPGTAPLPVPASDEGKPA